MTTSTTIVDDDKNDDIDEAPLNCPLFGEF